MPGEPQRLQPLQLSQVAAVHRQYPIELGEIVRGDLARPPPGKFIASTPGRGKRARIGWLPHLVVARTRRVDGDSIEQPDLPDKGSEHTLGYGRAADVS